MKKILFMTVILFTCIMSATNIGNPNMMRTHGSDNERVKLNQIKQQKRLEKIHKMIDTIEFQAEIKIPNYVDTNGISITNKNDF
jgi:hypothetical protein